MVAKTWAENIWRESVRTVIGLLPLRNGSRFIASFLSAIKIHDEYRLNDVEMIFFSSTNLISTFLNKMGK